MHDIIYNCYNAGSLQSMVLLHITISCYSYCSVFCCVLILRYSYVENSLHFDLADFPVNLIISHTHTHPFNDPFSGTTRVSRYQKEKPIWILLTQEIMSGSGISWDICKSASRCRQITTPAPHHSVFYRPDALPAAQPTASKHWRHNQSKHILLSKFLSFYSFHFTKNIVYHVPEILIVDILCR